MFEKVIQFIRRMYNTDKHIPLHEPRFMGNEKKYLNDCIDSTYVSYLGEFVTKFEDMIKDLTNAGNAISTANGTLALHIALHTAGVKSGDEVLTQALTFVATANAISHCGARPLFVDSERETLGMSPEKLEDFLVERTIIKDDGFCYNKATGNRIVACVPVHIFGHPAKIDIIKSICDRNGIVVVEDAAESLGSTYHNKHTGTYGKFGILSFNGNKIITTGGGGMVITDDGVLAERVRYIITTAKVPHKWEISHDEIGYNYRLPNINAALGCAQMENLHAFLQNKRELAYEYERFFREIGIEFFTEKDGYSSNYWLNAIILKDRTQRDEFLEYSYKNDIMVRPIWTLMNKLTMYRDCQTTNLDNAQWLEDRVVNIPSSVRL
jgi:perosamine synthetase